MILFYGKAALHARQARLKILIMLFLFLLHKQKKACKGTVFRSIEVVKCLVDKTSTSTGLKVFSTIKDKVYATARKVSKNFKENMEIVFDDNLGKWNYKVIPTVKS